MAVPFDCFTQQQEDIALEENIIFTKAHQYYSYSRAKMKQVISTCTADLHLQKHKYRYMYIHL